YGNTSCSCDGPISRLIADSICLWLFPLAKTSLDKQMYDCASAFRISGKSRSNSLFCGFSIALMIRFREVVRKNDRYWCTKPTKAVCSVFKYAGMIWPADLELVAESRMTGAALMGLPHVSANAREVPH